MDIKILAVFGIALLLVAAVSGCLKTGTTDFLSVQYFDAYGKLIQPSIISQLSQIIAPASIVGGVQGVSSIALVVTIQNTGEIPLVVSVSSASPPQLATALSGMSVAVGVGKTMQITSSQIAVAQFEGQTVPFQVATSGAYTYAGRAETLSKSGSISLKVEKDLVASYGISLGSSVGAAGNATCVTTGTTCSGSKTETCCSPSICSVEVMQCKANTCAGLQTSIDGNGCPIYTVGTFKCLSTYNCCDKGSTSNYALYQATCVYGGYDGNCFKADGSAFGVATDGSVCRCNGLGPCTFYASTTVCGGGTPLGDMQCS